MWFASATWLLLLVPWAALVVWFLLGGRRRVRVPFLELWKGPVPIERTSHRARIPPAFVLLVLLALLLAILGAARPAVRGGADNQRLTIVIDRGASMSARGTRDARFVELAVALSSELEKVRSRQTSVEIISVPGTTPIETTLGECEAVIHRLAPTMLETHDELWRTLTQLTSVKRPVFVVSDQSLEPLEGVIQVAPEEPVHDVGIEHLSVRERPRPQAMVRVRNQSPGTKGRLSVESNGWTIEQAIDLPARGAERDYFIDISGGPGAVVKATLTLAGSDGPQGGPNAPDELPGNDSTWVVREGSWPRIEARAGLPAELDRLIEAYHKSRPPTDASTLVEVVTSQSQVGASRSSVIVAPAADAMAGASLKATDHPLTQHVGWHSLAQTIRVAADAPEGWKPVVSAGNRPLVAVAPGDVRKVWVGFEAPGWETSADYVVFWTNIFDWVGGGSVERYRLYPLSAWTSEWTLKEPPDVQPGTWPGLYRRSDGAMRAFAAPDIIFPPPPQSDWRRALSEQRRRAGGARDLMPVFILIALGLIAAAGAIWKSSGSRRATVEAVSASY